MNLRAWVYGGCNSHPGNQADSCKFILALVRFVLVSSYHCFSIRDWLVLCAAASHRVGSSRDAQHALRFALPLGYSSANSPIACLPPCIAIYLTSWPVPSEIEFCVESYEVNQKHGQR